MHIKLGTRGSKLALTQAELIKEALITAQPEISVEIIEIKTSGDLAQGTDRAAKGDKKDWIFELEKALIDGTIDIAVHSGKDIPSDYEKVTTIISALKREDPRDVFIGSLLKDGTRLKFNALPKSAVVGTSSLRRKASILRLNPDLKIIDHRGNVPTRISKLDNSDSLSGIILAAAGLSRLKISNINDIHYFDTQDVMPAVNQGILAIQYLTAREDLKSVLAKIQDLDTEICFLAERSCVEVLGADCNSCVSVFANIVNGNLLLSARILSSDGDQRVEIIDRPILKTRINLECQLLANEILSIGGRELL